jgi:glycosyltransferase involved in cell wall biosynthesis
MSNKKLLTICLPTYNRAKYLKMQLERFASMPLELWEDIKLFISDNCSSDDTMEIGKEYSGLPGTDIVYSRNSSNLGMDGNFVKCYKYADTNYVWLLGDDDTIIIERLKVVLNTLKEKELGILHLGNRMNVEEDVTLYDSNPEEFLKCIGMYTTFISGNIVNVKYVKEIDFDKYFGTFLTLTPLYLKAMISEKFNVMINNPVFEDSKDSKRNGGYGICTVFVKNYLDIFKEFEDKGLLSNDLFIFEKNIALNFVRGFVVKNYIFKEKSNFLPEDTWGILHKYYNFQEISKAFTKEFVLYFWGKINKLKIKRQN